MDAKKVVEAKISIICYMDILNPYHHPNGNLRVDLYVEGITGYWGFDCKAEEGGKISMDNLIGGLSAIAKEAFKDIIA